MKISLVSLIASTGVFSPADAAYQPRSAPVYAPVSRLSSRASPEAPNGYAPKGVDCPQTRPKIRDASSLSPQELAWLPTRRKNTVTPMRELLARLGMTGFDTNAYMDKFGNDATALPNIAIAASGGGYRAMLNGAGAIAAFDSRTPNSTSKGHIGGLLQSATYFSGLSGGSWLLGSIYVNNFTSIQAIMDANPDQQGSLWQLGNSIYEGPATSKIQTLGTIEYFVNLIETVRSKQKAGFNVSLTDFWARGLSFQLVNATDGGPSITWSSLQDDQSIKSGSVPLPLVVVDGRAPGELLIPSNTTNFEFTPWEMGSFDSTLGGFAPLRYVGSNFKNGILPDNEPCVAGFDNAAFVMGTSSSLFNQIVLNLDRAGVPTSARGIVTAFLNTLSKENDDIADYSPNPFYGFNNASNRAASSHRLTLVDGGEDLQNLPLHPLLQPQRKVDVIFAVDSSADTIAPGAANWPNGTALVASYQRSLNPSIDPGIKFPVIPDENTFVNLGLNNRPTFFGCDTSSSSSSHRKTTHKSHPRSRKATSPAPLIVYIPNAPYVYYSNTSTFQMKYTNAQRNALIANGYAVATMGNATRDGDWPACVGCAVLARSLARTGTRVPDICAACFARYCWNGTVRADRPAPYAPRLLGAEIVLGRKKESAGKSMAKKVLGGLVKDVKGHFAG